MLIATRNEMSRGDPLENKPGLLHSARNDGWSSWIASLRSQ